MFNKTLEKITEHLIIYSALLDNIGLMNGKMGIALFFYHLYQVTKNENHLAYANKLIENITSKLDYHIPRTFFDGLIGISWGFDYIKRNNFMFFEDEDILTELDQALLEINVANLYDESFNTGVRGIAYYIISRCSGKAMIPAPFTKEYICILLDRMNRIEPKDLTSIQMLTQLQQIKNGNTVEYDLNTFCQLIGNDPYDESNLFIPTRNIGIMDNGYTGIALRLLKKWNANNEKNCNH